MVSLKLATHFFTYGSIFGITCYQSFFAGLAAYKALPLEMFSRLQKVIFKGYFTIQTVLQTLLIATVPFKPVSWIQIACLGGVWASAATNLFVINPRAYNIITERAELARQEGLSYKDPAASDSIKLLNKNFSSLHAKSMIVNVLVLFGTVVYGFTFVSRISI